MFVHHSTILMDALYNLDDRSGASDDYRKGILVGIVSTIMAAGSTFGDALREVVDYTKVQHRAALRRCSPSAWKEPLDKLIPVSGTNAHGCTHFVK